MTVAASTEYLTKVRDFVAGHARDFGFSNEEIEDIRLAVDEAFTNVVKHAYRFDSSKNVKITLGTHNNEFWISLRDHGKSFNPKSYHEPDLVESIKKKRRGGIGIFLIKKIMDGVEYRRMGSSNEILMKKIL